MKLKKLRQKHPRLIYKSFATKQLGNALQIDFSFVLEPNIFFRPQLTIPVTPPVDKFSLKSLVFNLGLVESLSYWKAACPQELLVEAGSLNQEQINWWRDLFLHGLGEFFYKNNLDFTQPGFLNIVPASSVSYAPHTSRVSFDGDLVLVGGGKDSAVTLELLKKSGRPARALILNPTRAALDNVKIAGLQDSIIVKRTIDPKLLELNVAGYLNGHTPFNTYLAFLGLFVAACGFENVIASNEASANEGNVTFHGVEMNHQYAKSYAFEKTFREYAAKYLTKKHQYFSLLRPLNELQIAKLFSRYPQYFSSFRSCNVGSKTDSWCGKCAKCAFVYISLSPFVSYEKLLAIFGTKPETTKFIQEIRSGRKPFECVGTREEVEQALAKKPNMSFWNPQHFVPKEYLRLLPYGRNSR